MFHQFLFDGDAPPQFHQLFQLLLISPPGLLLLLLCSGQKYVRDGGRHDARLPGQQWVLGRGERFAGRPGAYHACALF